MRSVVFHLEAEEEFEQQTRIHGDVLPRDLLASGFEFSGHRIPLISRQGIFKPKVLPEIPISITTTTTGPYHDRISPDGLMLYRWRDLVAIFWECQRRLLRCARNDRLDCFLLSNPYSLIPQLYNGVLVFSRLHPRDGLRQVVGHL